MILLTFAAYTQPSFYTLNKHDDFRTRVQQYCRSENRFANTLKPVYKEGWVCSASNQMNTLSNLLSCVHTYICT